MMQSVASNTRVQELGRGRSTKARAEKRTSKTRVRGNNTMLFEKALPAPEFPDIHSSL
jgi:hypothetical protein